MRIESLEELPEEGYIINKSSERKHFYLLERVCAGRMFPIALNAEETNRKWSYFTGAGNLIEKFFSIVNVTQKYIEVCELRVPSKKELAFILLQLENNNET